MLLGQDIGEPWAPGQEPKTPTQNAAELKAKIAAALASQAKAKPKAKAKAKAKAAPAAAAAGVGAKLAQLPWLKLGLVAAGVAGAYVLLSGRAEAREERANPDDDEPDEEELDENPRRAIDFYRKFHWGREPKRIRKVELAPRPSELVKLGVLEAVTYSAKKGGSKLADYIHHFGETGKKRPVLAADPRSRRLHIVGGEYDVKAAGIVD